MLIFSKEISTVLDIKPVWKIIQAIPVNIYLVKLEKFFGNYMILCLTFFKIFT